MSNILLDAANLLEKAAAYIEQHEVSRTKKEAEERLTEANILAEKVSAVTGMGLNDHVIEKLSEADPSVKELIKNIATADVVDSLGGPEPSNTKFASDSSEAGSAEQKLLDFLVSM